MSVGAVYCVYEDWRWLNLSIKSVYDVCDKIYFMISIKPYFGQMINNENNKKTIDIINNYPDKDNKFKIIYGDWGQSQADQRNEGLNILKEDGIQYCFVIDADEIYETFQLKSMLTYVSYFPTIPVWRCQALTYWKNEKYIIDPPESYLLQILVQTDGRAKFVECREANVNGQDQSRAIPIQLGVMHHMSYARTDEEIKRKMETFAHAPAVVSNWYENVWLAWDNNHNLENLNPCWPAAYRRAVEISETNLPSVFRS